MPVATLLLDQAEIPFFDFSEEWVSKDDIDINNPDQVLEETPEILDITSLVEHYQILCDTNEQGEAIKLLSANSKEEWEMILKEEVESGRLRYINSEANINVSPVFKRIKLIEYIKDLSKNVDYTNSQKAKFNLHKDMEKLEKNGKVQE